MDRLGSEDEIRCRIFPYGEFGAVPAERNAFISPPAVRPVYGVVGRDALKPVVPCQRGGTQWDDLCGAVVVNPV